MEGMTPMINFRNVDNIGHLVLANPPDNPMNLQFFEELEQIIHKKVPSSGVYGILVYGADRHFSSGANLSELLTRVKKEKESGHSTENELPGFLKQNTKLLTVFRNLGIPTVAAISGVCLGSGLELALHCDYRICSDRALLGFPEITFNLMTGCGGSIRLFELAGRARSMELLLSGRNFSPKEALTYHVVDKVVPKKNLVGESITFLKIILPYLFKI